MSWYQLRGILLRNLTVKDMIEAKLADERTGASWARLLVDIQAHSQPLIASLNSEIVGIAASKAHASRPHKPDMSGENNICFEIA